MAFESQQQLLIYYWLQEVSQHFSLEDSDIEYAMDKWEDYQEKQKSAKILCPEKVYYYDLVAFCESILRKFIFDSLEQEEEVMEIFRELQQLYRISIKREVTI